MVLQSSSSHPWLPSEQEGEGRMSAPAVARNRDAIGTALRSILPETGLVLELASGSGEHVVHFASLYPELVWQPSDNDPRALSSIAAWRRQVGLANVLEPLLIDAAAPEWTLSHASAVLCINMVHISPWSSTTGAIEGARRLLAAGQSLIFYGPFKQAGIETAASNLAFDAALRARNADWGLRSVDDIVSFARGAGFHRETILNMPSNNLILALQV
ncbi:DUF938 domain-containing protein [Rhizobium leguminosarum]|nr:DUF938 domain-containing protein [Rhizobium leguminosarum]TBF87445.1 DUF938 domain-containing protein [Rhizobium leguminosarum]TBG07058.1 DUF938 domain-containing protein [Rhizobium leguminosarum]TBG07790.1 DUF938 domain-containing protein [Rhizobium leguminosarum]TBG30749.1 DUF938 domain-containing protein [Rhizobium leguminosarum]TBG50089.1 DUF938 domain-containing protein [Rhizobium leguminosarum]